MSQLPIRLILSPHITSWDASLIACFSSSAGVQDTMAEPVPITDGFANSILAQLSSECVAELRPVMYPVDLEVRQVIYEANRPAHFAYFPESGMISVVAIMENGSSIEVSTIGRDGLVGGFLLLGIDRLPYRYFVQVAGRAHRIEAVRLRQEAERNSALCKAILKYQAALLSQSMQLIACNGLHTIQQRCCRWLLTTRDRSDSDEIVLTHEFLALMLGVRRASISEVLSPLQEAGLIKSARGRITVLNRKALEAGACECYHTIRDQHRQITG